MLFFLAVMATAARANPAPQGLIALTAEQVRHLFTSLVHRPLHTRRTCWAGHIGDADTSPSPANATTAGRPPSNSHDHELGWY